MTKKQLTNYEKNKEQIARLCSKGAVCYSCLAREVCNSLCKERNINTANSVPPCFESWLIWLEAKA